MKRKSSSNKNDPSSSSRQQQEQQRQSRGLAQSNVNITAARRREGMAEVARRRAQHFATWEAGGGQSNDGVHTGTTSASARELGPWSSAVQLANAVEKERDRRNEKILEEARNSTPNKKPKTIWKPSRDNRSRSLGTRSRDPLHNVPSLSATVLRLIVDLLDDVESLYGLPDSIRNQIAAEACLRRRLSSVSALQLFVDHSPSEISIPDCSLLDADVLGAGLLQAATPKLEKLSLGLCGRGMTAQTVEKLTAHGVLSSLKGLHLGGAYRLYDNVVEALLRKTPNLECLSLPQCSRIEGSVIESLPNLVPKLVRLEVAECRGVGGQAIASAVGGLNHLKELVLDGIPDVTDDLLAALGALSSSNSNLVELSVAACPGVTGQGVATAVASLPALTSLNISECTDVDDSCIATIVRCCKNLKKLSCQRCTLLTDAALSSLSSLPSLSYLDLNGVKEITDEGVVALARGSCAPSLTVVDVSWCRKVSSQAMGLLADSCHGLRTLRVWGCSQLDDSEFFWGHSNDSLAIIGR